MDLVPVELQEDVGQPKPANGYVPTDIQSDLRAAGAELRSVLQEVAAERLLTKVRSLNGLTYTCFLSAVRLRHTPLLRELMLSIMMGPRLRDLPENYFISSIVIHPLVSHLHCVNHPSCRKLRM